MDGGDVGVLAFGLYEADGEVLLDRKVSFLSSSRCCLGLERCLLPAGNDEVMRDSSALQLALVVLRAGKD